MKKRNKGLLGVWLALLLTIISVPEITQADTAPVQEYDITISSAGNGTCRVQVDGEEVSSAAAQQKVTILPVPADTYELDTVTVTKKEDEKVTITVTDNSFIMPDYPVRVYVTFKRPACHITLPSGTGYRTVPQHSETIEYGSRYTFTIQIDDAYEAAKSFSVSSNDIVLTPSQTDGNTYTYTLYFVAGDQTIRVTGVEKKDTAGTGNEKPPETPPAEDEIWLRDGISVSGLYPLKPDTSYKLCSGKWKVAGDDTVYEGSCTIYVDESSHFAFQKQ